MIYSASVNKFRLKIDRLNAKKLRATWWDPRSGKNESTFSDIENSGAVREFTPPSSGDAKDWVLVLDDVTKNYPPPGEK
jgi:hypothetical protein